MESPVLSQKKIYWHASTSSGGTLSIAVDLQGEFSNDEKQSVLAEAIQQCAETMEMNGYIPHYARLMSSRDISEFYGKTRQYWEKLLTEGKILYKETSAGRITTDLWVQGYLGNKEQVDKYVKDVKAILKSINELENKNRWWQKIDCPVCNQNTFEFAVNGEIHVNGICRNHSCGFHVHTTS